MNKLEKSSLFFIPLAGLLISFVIFVLTLTSTSEAASMKNQEYKIQEGSINPSSQETVKNQNKITSTEKGEMVGFNNYKIRSGFQYIDSSAPFTFSIASLSINFGTLNPGEPITRTNTLTISNGSAAGYLVTTEQTGSLKTPHKSEIQDTTCDAGTCTESRASIWDSPLAYGFGYRCDNIAGNTCSKDFAGENFYKQFANRQNNEPAETVMSGSSIDEKIQTQITYKVNIPATQIKGHYQNTIIYIAIPSI